MRNISVLLEALDYAKEEGLLWYNVVGTIREAKQLLGKVKKEKLDEYETIELAEHVEVNLYTNDHELAIEEALLKLKQELEEE